MFGSLFSPQEAKTLPPHLASIRDVPDGLLPTRDLEEPLYARILRLLHDAGVPGPRYLVLSYVSRYGEAIDGELRGMPRALVHAMILGSRLRESSSGGYDFIYALEDEGYLAPHTAARPTTKRSHPARRTRNFVVLTRKGANKVREVHQRIAELIAAAASGVPDRKRKELMTSFLEAAPKLLERIGDPPMDAPE